MVWEKLRKQILTISFQLAKKYGIIETKESQHQTGEKITIQTTFSDIEYGNRKRTTKSEEFFDIMEEIIPWDEWVEFVCPYYHVGKRSRPAKKIEKTENVSSDMVKPL